MYVNELKIQNFGAITSGYDKNSGYLEFKQNTFFCGSQGTGKSSIAKIYSTFVWLEKALLRGDLAEKDLEKRNVFVNKYLKFQNIDSYVKYNTLLHFRGQFYDFIFSQATLEVKKKNPAMDYDRPKITYMAAERNLISILGREGKKNKMIPYSLLFLVSDFDEACENIKGDITLPINDIKFKYDKLNSMCNVYSDSFKLKLRESSSGLQSATPLYITLKYMYDKVINGEYEDKKSSEEIEKTNERIRKVLLDDTLSDEARTSLIKLLSDNKNKRLISIVEEPEQNLYPETQENLLYELLHLSGTGENQLVITTHSPYIINSVTLAIKAKQVAEKLRSKDLQQRLDDLVPYHSMIDGTKATIYELYLDGSIRELKKFNDMPSDENQLNTMLERSNEKFDAILDLKDEEEERN